MGPVFHRLDSRVRRALFEAVVAESFTPSFVPCSPGLWEQKDGVGGGRGKEGCANISRAPGRRWLPPEGMERTFWFLVCFQCIRYDF